MTERNAADLALTLSNRLRLKHLGLLAALKDSDTLRRAAERTNMTQPAATKMLGDVERAFDAPLFTRHARGMEPTPLGTVVMTFAVQLQASLARFSEDFVTKRRGGHGQLVFGAIMGAAPDIVAHAVAGLKRERPLLNVRIVGETSDLIGRMLERGEIELAVGRISTPLDHNHFVFESLANELLQIVVRAKHLVGRRKGLTLKDLIDMPWIVQPMTSPSRLLIEREFSKVGMATPRNLVESQSIFAALQLVQASDAVAVLPESVVRDHVMARLLKPLAIPIGETLTDFGVLTRRGEPLSDAARALIIHLRAVSKTTH